MVDEANCLVCGAPFRPKMKRGAYTRHCSNKCGYVTRSRERRRAWQDRYWEKVDKSDPSGCWLWTGGTTNFGYGVFSLAGTKDLHGAHRVAWRLHHGHDAGKKCVLHRCDTPGCVNPDHLFLGSRVENMEDKIRKGRQPKGEATGRAKLSEDQVLAIQSDHRSQAKIASEYGVDQSTISNIKTGASWGHLGGVADQV